MARLSMAGVLASHTPAVKVVCQSGITSGGNARTGTATLHPAEQVSVDAELWPAVNCPGAATYQNTVPLELVPLIVRVTLWNDVTALLKRAWPAPRLWIVGAVFCAANNV